MIAHTHSQATRTDQGTDSPLARVGNWRPGQQFWFGVSLAALVTGATWFGGVHVLERWQFF